MQVIPELKAILLRLRQPELVRKVLPHWSRDINHEGHNIAVKLDLEVVKVLRNMGIKVPSPIHYQYDWPRPAWFTTVFEHQKVTADFLTVTRRGFVLNEMGTAKTASALWAADYLMTKGVVKKVLVVSPLSTLETVWVSEIFNLIMHRTAALLHGPREKRLELLARDFDFYIVNHDGLKIIADEVNKRKDINLVIVDEAAAYRNGQTARYDVLKKMLRTDMWLWLMTGTPCPNAPTDAWSLAKLVNPTTVPTYFGTWKRQTMVQLSQYKWAPRVGSNKMAFDALQPAVRFKKADCLDLPPVTYESRQVELTDEQKRAYRDMKNKFAAELATQTLAAGSPAEIEIIAVNAADKISKLRQILCGVVKDPESDLYIPLDHSPRVQVLLECIEQAGHKVIVIVPFKGIINTLHEEISATYSCEVMNGDVPPKKRADIVRRFKEEDDPHVLLCHPRVMAHGLTLTEADTMIFYAPIYSNEETQQVVERINRPGQKHKMTIIRMGASTLEWGIYAAVEGKRLSQENILELYRKELTTPT